MTTRYVQQQYPHEGWLMKKSWISNWNKRYFILQGTLIFYGKGSNIEGCRFLYDLSCKGCRVEINQLLSRDILTLWNGNLKIFSCYGETQRETARWYGIFWEIINQHQQSILYEGYLNKRGSFVKNWKSRYAVLTAEKLVYYSHTPKTDSFLKKGEIYIDATTTIHLLVDTPSHPNRFSVTTRIPSNSNSRQASRVLYISVINLERREEWVTALREAIAIHMTTSQNRPSAFALLSDPGQPFGWMFEDELNSSPPSNFVGFPGFHDSPEETCLNDRVSSE